MTSPGEPSVASLRLTRRAVLVGGASTLALAACSSKSSNDSASASTRPQAPSLLAFFPLNDYITAGVPQRVAFGLAEPGGGLASTGPDPAEFTITDPDGATTTRKIPAHGVDLPNVYYPIAFTPAKAGTFTVATTVDGQQASASFTVAKKGSSDIPGPTDKMPALASPTVDDHLGVDPICTQDPACPLHAVSLADALADDKPVVYLVGTPKFCQTGICGPVLDVLLATTDAYADRVTFIHQEVYQSADEAAEDGANASLTEAVQALQLQAEPVLFVVDAGGIIRYRLDAAYDRTELSAALDSVLA